MRDKISQNHRVSFQLTLASALLFCALTIGNVLGDEACEKKLNATGMTYYKDDAKSLCDQGPSVEIQDCTVNLLKHGKGKLRIVDFMEVYALCAVDASKEVQDCFTKQMNKSIGDPAYKTAQVVGDRCLMDRPGLPVTFLHKPTPPRKKKSQTSTAPTAPAPAAKK